MKQGTITLYFLVINGWMTDTIQTVNTQYTGSIMWWKNLVTGINKTKCTINRSNS